VARTADRKPIASPDAAINGVAAAPDPVALLQKMMDIRRFEEKAAEMYARGKIRGFLHLYIGQEAVATGAIDALRPDDYLVTHYRDHGHALARGLNPGRVMAELFGKSTGVTGGRGGSMHLFDVSKSFMGGYAIVAGHMPLACGLALAEQYKSADRIVVNFMGDGAVNEGEFHEALNLASVWKLPVLFICENNLYGMGTAMRRVSALVEVYKRAEAYGIDAEQVDGMDVLAVHEAVSRLAAGVRAGNGPAFLEAICFRYRGHSISDADLYRPKQEVARWKKFRGCGPKSCAAGRRWFVRSSTVCLRPTTRTPRWRRTRTAVTASGWRRNAPAAPTLIKPSAPTTPSGVCSTRR
jgi:pyruvate dehydrogenase E1 component alpha subunit